MSSYPFSFAELKAFSHDVSRLGRPLLTSLIPIAQFFSRLMPRLMPHQVPHKMPHKLLKTNASAKYQYRNNHINPHIGLINQSASHLPYVKLVGAGPGDPGLLTINAYEAIQSADVVLYDWLVSEAVLALIPRHVKREFVGKRAHRHSMTQLQINQRLVELALTGVNVVRLKGGDPAFFSRINEEASALEAHAINYSIVPGITTASALTAYSGIALTQRNIARKVTFMTAQSAEQMLSPHLPHYCAEHTLVIYMGKNKLYAVTQQLKALDWPATTPIAIVESVSLPEQIECRGQLDNICAKAAQQLNDGPAIIIVGEVVSHSMQVSSSSLRLEQERVA